MQSPQPRSFRYADPPSVGTPRHHAFVKRRERAVLHDDQEDDEAMSQLIIVGAIVAVVGAIGVTLLG